MIRIIRNYFTFDFFSPLDYETCNERFTFEYKEKLMKENKYVGDKWYSWYSLIYTKKKKNAVRVDSNWGQFSVTYLVTLERVNNGTLLHCKHNPLGITAWFFPTLFAALLSIGLLAGLIDHLIFPKSGSPIAFAVLIIFFALIIVSICLAYLPIERTARDSLTRLAGQLVGAWPVK